jgi:hypothetical protein
MSNKAAVCIGLALFGGVATLPFWLPGARRPMPQPVLKAGLTECVESAEYMRANHMLLLDAWRNSVVREGNRRYVNAAGKPFEKSLERTCLDCHSNKAEFCDRCHQSVAVQPYCWNCHFAPGELRPAAAAMAGSPALRIAATGLSSPGGAADGR